MNKETKKINKKGKTNLTSLLRSKTIGQNKSKKLAKEQDWSETVFFLRTVDGGVSAWSVWSECRGRRCGREVRKRRRKCSNPPPANGGKSCVEPLVQIRRCQVKHCKCESSSNINILFSKELKAKLKKSQHDVAVVTESKSQWN